jgi:hypothetical protein
MVAVAVSVLVSLAVEVTVEVRVSVGGRVSLGVNEGKEIVAGRPTTRATRNCSTIPSLFAVKCNFGHIELMIGAIKG